MIGAEGSPHIQERTGMVGEPDGHGFGVGKAGPGVKPALPSAVANSKRVSILHIDLFSYYIKSNATLFFLLMHKSIWEVEGENVGEKFWRKNGKGMNKSFCKCYQNSYGQLWKIFKTCQHWEPVTWLLSEEFTIFEVFSVFDIILAVLFVDNFNICRAVNFSINFWLATRIFNEKFVDCMYFHMKCSDLLIVAGRI